MKPNAHDHLLVGKPPQSDVEVAMIAGEGPIRTLSFRLGIVVNVDLRIPTAISFIPMQGVQISIPHQPQINLGTDVGADRDFYNLLVSIWRNERTKSEAEAK